MEDILRALIALPTVDGNSQAQHKALSYIADFVADRGMHVVWHESGGYESIVATVKPDDLTPKVLLAAHVDVVPADEAMFEMRAENGRLHGRGVLDMKFAIAAYMQIIDELYRANELNGYDLGLMITADEEVGGRSGVAMLINKGYMPQVCILPDGGDNWHIQTGSKGILLYDITSSGVASHGSRPWHGDNALTKLIGLYHELESFFPPQPGPDTNTLS